MGIKQTGMAMPIAIPPSSVPLLEKVAQVSRADQAARGLDARIRQVMAVYRDGVARIQTANSLGEFTESERTGTLFVAQVVASDNDIIQTGYETLGGCRGFDLFNEKSPEEIALTAAKRAVMMLSARKAPAGVMPVVLSSEAGGTMVHEAVGHGLEADLVQSGVSVYRGKMGEQVASPLVTVVDDATIPYARGSFPFDSEGVAGRKTVLVENGILKGYLYDRLTAMKDGCASTGRARGRFRLPPVRRLHPST